MSQQTLKSRPVYSRLRRDPGARYCLLLADGPGVVSGGLAPGAWPQDFDERWTVVSQSRAIPPAQAGAADHEFRSAQHLLIALQARLSRERMGLRLYAVGAEPFLWRVHGVGDEFGMGPHEVHLCANGPAARRVFCGHCRTIGEGVTTNVFTCAGCGAALLVRDHFSRRLNAFAGVQVDAEAPGELPDIEALYG